MGINVGPNQPKSGASSLPPGSSPVSNAPAAAQPKGAAAEQGAGVKAESAKKPTVRFDADNVSTDAAGKARDLSGLGEPELPPVDAKASEKKDQQDIVAGLIGTLFELGQNVASAEGLSAVIERANFLAAHPEQSHFLEQLPPHFADSIVQTFKELPPGAGLDVQQLRTLGGDRLANFMLEFQTQNTNMFINMLTKGPNGEAPLMGFGVREFAASAQALSGFADAFLAAFVSGQVTPEMVEQGARAIESIPHDGRDTPPLESPAFTLTNESTIDPVKAKEAANFAVLLGEAGYEFLIGQFSRVASQDHQDQLKLMNQMLGTLRSMKEGLVAQLRGKTSEVQGAELMSGVQAQAAEAAKKKAEDCQIVTAFAMVVVAVVVAVISVCAALWSGGSSLVVGFLIVAAIASCLAAAATVAQNLPYLLMGFGAEEAGRDMLKWMNENKWFSTMLLVVQVICALAAIVGGVGAGVTAAGSAVSQSIKWANAAVQIGSGLFQVGMAISQNAIQKELIAANAALEQLKLQLQALDNMIAELKTEIDRYQRKEDNEIDRLREENEHKENIDRNINKAREIGHDMAMAIVDMFVR